MDEKFDWQEKILIQILKRWLSQSLPDEDGWQRLWKSTLARLYRKRI